MVDSNKSNGDRTWIMLFPMTRVKSIFNENDILKKSKKYKFEIILPERPLTDITRFHGYYLNRLLLKRL